MCGVRVCVCVGGGGGSEEAGVQGYNSSIRAIHLWPLLASYKLSVLLFV